MEEKNTVCVESSISASNFSVDREVVLLTCLAVRQNREENAKQGFTFLLKSLQEAADDDAKICALKQVETCLLAAVRRKNTQLAQGWLADAEPFLISLMQQKELMQQTAEFWLSLTFAVCDKKMAALQPNLQNLLRAWVRNNGTAEAAVYSKLLSEILSLAARMARRDWQEEKHFLLRQVLWCAVRFQSLVQWQMLLTQFALHFVVYVRWDGFHKACFAYPELVELYLIMLCRAGKAGLSATMQAAYLQIALRDMRDLVANASRCAMQDDMEIFRQWYQFFWQLAGDNSRRKGRLLLLLQLAIKYWLGTRPKTGRKQVRFLEDLLNPNLIKEPYETLLQNII